jgi:hypothetical protein
MPGVSVIIPAFNAAATLNATIQSVVRQTYEDWEAIIVDDGSTDFTDSNAKVWCARDPRFHLIKTPNRGVSAARNEGARYATAPWLLFVDADDLIVASHLATMLAKASDAPKADLIYCASAKIAADGRIGKPETATTSNYFKQLAKYDIFCTHGCLIRRRAFEDAAGFDTALMICEDWDLWQRFARAGLEFAPVEDCLALYRMRPHSLSHNAELLFGGARQVIMRGHTSDPRVREPVPALADGEPFHESGPAVIAFALWCSGLLIGAGVGAANFLLRAALPSIEAMDVDRAISVIQGSVPAGACLLQEDWPRLWPPFKDRIYEAFSIIEHRCQLAQFADRCMAELATRLNYLSPLPKSEAGLSFDMAGK